jgi:hypothetical protein
MRPLATCLCLCLGLGLGADRAGAEWHRYLIDATGTNLGTSVALRDGIPFVAYYSNAGLRCARWAGDGWQIDLVDPRTSEHNRGPSLVFDADGVPHIGFYCGTPWVARLEGDSWIAEQIDAENGGDYISLAFDGAGGLHAAYSKPVGLFDALLKYAWRDGSGWRPEIADADGGYDCVLRFDEQGRPCVAHCASWSSGALYLSVRTPTGWSRETLLANNASQSFMTLDAARRPRLSYYWVAGGAYDLRYADREGPGWRFDVVDHGEQLFKRGWDNCIAIGPDGTFHISYHAHNESQLRYAHGAWGAWQVEVVDAVGLWDLFSSIAVDDAGRPFIAYVDENEGHAVYLATQAALPAGLSEREGAAPRGTRLVAWPNPARGWLSVRLPEASGPTARDFRLCDLTGRIVARFPRAGRSTEDLDLRGLPAGAYFLSLPGRESESITLVR